jgi:DAACS family dicarboxylate/amino acid:cation (Na+ or H+) symporter
MSSAQQAVSKAPPVKPSSLILALIAGMILGTAAHQFPDAPMVSEIAKHILPPVGQIFLRLIFMIVVPVVFSAIVLGIYELAEGQQFGKIARRTLSWTVILSGISVAVGVTLVNLVQPGHIVSIDMGIAGQAKDTLSSISASAAAGKSFGQALVDIIPRNPLEAAVKALDGEMLSLMFFALAFGFALYQTTGRPRTVHAILKELFDVCLYLMRYAMKLAPLAVFALTFGSFYRSGLELLAPLGAYVAVVIGGLLIQMLLVYGGALKIFSRHSPVGFFRQCQSLMLYAFATASSNASLPQSLETAEQRLKLPPRIARFVLTVGATANQNGTALFEGVTVLFLAQLTGVNLDLSQQMQVVGMSILAGVGTAGVPGGSLPLVMVLLQQLGIPPESLGLILGLDRLLDMCRTVVNVVGDLAIATLVSSGDVASSDA